MPRLQNLDRSGLLRFIVVVAILLAVSSPLDALANFECDDDCYRVTTWNLESTHPDFGESEQGARHFAELAMLEGMTPDILVGLHAVVESGTEDGDPFVQLKSRSGSHPERDYAFEKWTTSPASERGLAVAYDQGRVSLLESCSVETPDGVPYGMRARVLPIKMSCGEEPCASDEDDFAVVAIEISAVEDTMDFRTAFERLLVAVEGTPCRESSSHMQLLFVGSIPADCRDAAHINVWSHIRNRTFDHMGRWDEGLCDYASTSISREDRYRYDNDAVSPSVTFVLSPEAHTPVTPLCTFQSLDETFGHFRRPTNLSNNVLGRSLQIHSGAGIDTSNPRYEDYSLDVASHIPVSVGIVRRKPSEIVPREFDGEDVVTDGFLLPPCRLGLLPRLEPVDPSKGAGL